MINGIKVPFVKFRIVIDHVLTEAFQRSKTDQGGASNQKINGGIQTAGKREEGFKGDLHEHRMILVEF